MMLLRERGGEQGRERERGRKRRGRKGDTERAEERNEGWQKDEVHGGDRERIKEAKENYRENEGRDTGGRKISRRAKYMKEIKRQEEK